MTTRARSVLRDCQGVAAIEYALLASLIAAAALVGFAAVGEEVGSSYAATERAMPSEVEVPTGQ